MSISRLKLTYVSTNRADYEPFRQVLLGLNKSPQIDLSVIVSGAHLDPKFGNSWTNIEADDLKIIAKIPLNQTDSTSFSACIAIGRALEDFAKVFQKNPPDILLILGDRFELLPICSAAILMKIPIAHVSGGDVTEGALDEQVRHSLTKLAALHFPGTQESGSRIERMGEEKWRIHVVGEPGLDSIRTNKKADRLELALKFNLDLEKKWLLFTYHPETMNNIESDISRIRRFVRLASEYNEIQIVATYPNSDPGSDQIISEFEKLHASLGSSFIIVKNAGHINYLNLMSESWCIAGNSSSIIFESPSVHTPAINIGNRQKGRATAPNTISISGDDEGSLCEALNKVQNFEFRQLCKSVVNPYGDGFTTQKIVKIIESINLNKLLPKKFHDIC